MITTAILIAGALGGLLKSLMENQGRVTLPKLERATDGNNYVHFGFLLNLLLGAGTGIVAADPISAFTMGMSAAFVGETIIENTPIAKGA
jgi:hypothetical protein